MVNSYRILLAEDDIDDISLFKEITAVTWPELELVEKRNGLDAMEYLTGCDPGKMPDAILLDYNMPLVNGAELLDWMAARPHLHAIKKFVWSTANADHFRAVCLEKGAIDYFVKPKAEKELKAILRKLMEHCQPANQEGAYR